tara:strand:+ start:4637 stop:6046 length:1410 start_codon:yes stop_codon:yes gene_type:complete
MDYQEAHKKFRSIEDDLNLFDARIGDFAFWDYLRYPIWDQVLVATGLMDSILGSAKDVGLSSRICTKMRVIKNVLLRNPSNSPQADFVFIGGGASRRVLNTNDEYEDPWCDSLINYLGEERCQVWETSNSGRHHSYKYKNQFSSLDIFAQLESLSRVESKFFNILNKKDQSFISQIEARFDLDFGIQLNLCRQIEASMLRRKYILPVLMSCLKKVKPRAVFIMCSYFGREIYVEACRKLRIPIIEIQHGTISDYHLAYSYPKLGAKVMFPDYFLNFGRFWCDAVQLPIPQDRVFTLGYPSIESKLNLTGIKKKQIVFVSQRTIGLQLWEFASKLAGMLPPDWMIVYKLHPAEFDDWQARYGEPNTSNIEIVAADGPSLHVLFSESLIQVGVYSTAIYEGLALGCKTYLLDCPGVEYMQSLIDSGCSVVRLPEEVDLDNCKVDVWPDRECLFSKNWKSNFDTALCQMGLL